MTPLSKYEVDEIEQIFDTYSKMASERMREVMKNDPDALKEYFEQRRAIDAWHKDIVAKLRSSQ